MAKLVLSTWRSCARQVFAAVGPVRITAEGGGAPGIIAGTPAGLSAQVKADSDLLCTSDTPSLAKWPGWYTAQYDALIVQPFLQAQVLNSDENQPARVWREGRAQVAVAGAVNLHPKGEPGKRMGKPRH